MEVIIGVIRSVRADPLPLGRHGNPVAKRDRLRELLLRVARLADDRPWAAPSPGSDSGIR
jgi:hypothetical protein